jgi:hypothetical protein
MITFLDGPAEGKQLSLSRAPYFLRVVMDPFGNVDALDQLSDTIRDGEIAYVYTKAEDLGSVLYCIRGKGCRHEEHATYRVFSEQPGQDVLADNERWAEWATAKGREIAASKWATSQKSEVSK